MVARSKSVIPAPPVVAVVDNGEPPELRLARIQIYEQRAAARLPLFEDGEPATPEPPRGRTLPICFGCGVTAPAINHIYQYGWHSLPSNNRYYKVEVYCPTCFAEVR